MFCSGRLRFEEAMEEYGGPGQSRTADQRFRKRPLLPKHNNLASVGARSTPLFAAVVADTEHFSEHKPVSPERKHPAPTGRMLEFALRPQRTLEPAQFRPLRVSKSGGGTHAD